MNGLLAILTLTTFILFVIFLIKALKQKKKDVTTYRSYRKKCLVALLVSVISCVVLGIITDTGNPSQNEYSSGTQNTHLYDNAQVVDMLSGSGDVVGQESIINADSSDCTVEALSDWYYNYVKPNDFNVSVILYTDKPGKAVFCNNNSIVEVNVSVEKDANDSSYMQTNDFDSQLYVESDDHTTLIEYK